MTKNVSHSEPAKAKVSGIEIVYDTFGEPTEMPMLLIMRLGEQMIGWDEDFCEALEDRGYWVIRFDNRIKERAGRSFDRGLSLPGTARQLAAILASGIRRKALHSVSVPALIIHGDEDPLVPIECGKDTADSIQGAEWMIIKGIGHDLPMAVVPRIIESIVRHAA